MKETRDGANMMMSMPSTNADTASIFSDVELSSEGVDENGEPLLRGAYSSKAAHLANEIASMEQLVARLEERNKWLTGKLLMNRRKFIESHMLKTDAAIKSSMFHSWQQAMNLLRVESQLEKQTAALDQCQQVAKELGGALAQEQVARKRVEEANRTIRAELEKVLAFNEGLQQEGEASIRRGNMLERRLEEAENRIQSIKGEAISILENVELWDQRKAGDLEKMKRVPVEDEDYLGRSVRVREEAREVISKVASVLVPVGRRGASPPSPERERPGRPVGAISTISRYDSGAAAGPGGDSPAVRSPPKVSTKRSQSEHRVRAASQEVGYSASASLATLPTTPINGGRFGAWNYEQDTLNVMGASSTSSPQQESRARIYSGGSILQAPTTQPSMARVLGGSSPSPLVSGARPSGGGSPTSGSGGQAGQAQRNSRGEVLEPWWCVRRVNPNGTTTVTPQQLAPA